MAFLCMTQDVAAAGTDDFIITVRTDTPGSSSDTQFTIPVDSASGTYNYNVDCDDDGTNEATAVNGEYTCDYGAGNAGHYTIRIEDNTGTGTGFPAILFNDTGDKEKLLTVKQWGTGEWKNFTRAFNGCSYLEVTAVDAPDLSNVQSLYGMFHGATSFNQDIGYWDTSHVSIMTFMFAGATAFDQNLGSWNVGNVLDMLHMFDGVTLSTINYDNILIGWSAQNLQATVKFDAGSSKYCSGKAAKAKIVSDRQWAITDGGEECLPFVITVKTDNPGTSADTKFVIPTYHYNYNYDVDCDGASPGTNTLTGQTGNATCSYTNAGTYTIKITGDFPLIFFNNGGDKEKLLSIEHWGTGQWVSMQKAFSGCSNMTVPATDAPNLSAVPNLAFMFLNAAAANPDTSNWNTSAVTNMGSMFNGAVAANPDTSNWNTSAVTNMGSMFNGAVKANPNTSGWDTSAVTDMSFMFYDATLANPITITKGNIWNTSSVTNMKNMFQSAVAATPDTSGWDTSAVTDMSFMFYRATLATPITITKGNIWNTSSVTTMENMFASAKAATPDTSGWDTSAVTNMESMFNNAVAATPDTSNWNTSAVTTMERMFFALEYANPDTSNWDTSAVTNMSYMFTGCTAATPDTSNWNTSAVTTMEKMFSTTTLANPVTTTKGDIWNTSTVTNMKGMFSGAANAHLMDVSGWNTANVTDMSQMFGGLKNINLGISNWDTGKVTNMKEMFASFAGTNPDVRKWNTSQVTNMNGMFIMVTSFDRDIGHWDVTSLHLAVDGDSGYFTGPNTAEWMFYGVTLSTANYDALLNGWDAQVLEPGIVFDGGNSQYCAVKARENMTSVAHWTITDGGHAACLVEKTPVPTPATDTTPTYTFTSITGGAISYGGSCTSTTAAATPGDNTITFAALPDGIYDACTITVTDSHTNANTLPVSPFIVDQTAPVIAITAPTKLSNAAITDTAIQVTDNHGITATGVTVAASTTAATSNFSCTQTNPTTVACTVTISGSGNLTIKAVDTVANGNTATETGYVIDTTPPSDPTVTAPADGSAINDTTPTFTGTGEVGATVSVTDGNGHGCSATVDGSGNWNCDIAPALPGTGAVSFTVTQTDPAGNSSIPGTAVSVTIDTSAPAEPHVTAPTNHIPINSLTPTFTGTGEPGATVTVTDGENPEHSCTATVDASHNWSCNIAPALTEGATPTFTVTQTDHAGNPSPATTVATTADTTAPSQLSAPTVAGAPDTNDNTPDISGSDCTTGDTVSVQVNGLDIAPTALCTAGGYTITPAAAITDGAKSISVKATDAAGNPSTVSPGTSVTVDTVAPADPSCVTAPSHAKDATAVITTCISVETAAVVTIPGMTCAAESGGSVTCNGTVAAAGLDGVDTTVTLTDAAGNINNNTDSGLIIDNTAPHVPHVHLDLSVDAEHPTLTFSATDNIGIDHYEIDYIAVGGSAIITLNPATSPATLTLDLKNSPHTVTVRAVDAAGNTSESVVQFPLTVNFTAPTTLSNADITDSTVTITSPDGSNLATITISASSGSAPALTCPGTAPYTSPLTCTIGAITQIQLLIVTAVDVDGASGEKWQSYYIETVIPVIAVTAPTKSDNGDITDTTVEITDNYKVDAADVTITATNITDTFSITAVNCVQTHTTQVDCTLTLTGEGTGDLHIAVSDAAGNSATGDENAYLIDKTTPLNPTVTTPINGQIVGPNTLIFTGTGESGATVSVTDGAGHTCNAVVDSSGDWSCTVTQSFTNGDTPTFTVKQTDPTGNKTPTGVTVAVVIDTTLPPTPIVSAPANNSPVKTATPTFTGRGEVGATISVTDGAGHTCTAIVDSSGDWSCVIAPALPDTATPTFTVKQTTPAGNVSQVPATVSITIDTTAPAAPIVTAPADGSTTNNTTPTFIGTGETGATVAVSDGHGHTCRAIVDTSGDWSCNISPAFTDGANPTFTITQTDPAGSETPAGSTVTLTIDTAVPASPTVTTPAAGSETKETAPIFTGTGEVGATVTVTDGATPEHSCTAIVDNSGDWSCVISPALPDGATPTFTIKQTDLGGNESPAGTPVGMTVDTTAPAGPIVTAPADGSATNDTTPTFTGTGETGATVTVTDSGVPEHSCTAIVDGSGDWSCVIAPALNGGDNPTFSSKQTDPAGNESQPGTAVTLTVDTTAPAVPTVTAPTNGSVISNASPTFTGTGEPGATVSVGDGGLHGCTALVGSSGSWSCDIGPPLTDGATPNFTVKQTDLGGNESAATAPVGFTVDTTVPIVTEVTAVPSPTNDTTPDYTFDSSEAGTFAVGGSCGSSANAVTAGHNTIQFTTLTAGTYNDCSITVTDIGGNASIALAVTEFIVELTAPVVTEITAVSTPGNDATPDYTFNTDEAGSLTVGGSCASSTSTATAGDNTITFDTTLAEGTYSNCTITITDSAGNSNAALAVTEFIVDLTAPLVTETTPVPSPGNNSTPDYTFHSSEAGIFVVGGSCTSSTSAAAAGDNTIQFNTLTGGTYNDCSITVTDAAGNTGASLSVTEFIINLTAPVVAETTAVPTPDNDTTPDYTFNTTKAGAISYSGDCSSGTTQAVAGDNTITFNILSAAVHSNCEITVTDTAGNASTALSVSSFTIDTTAPATPAAAPDLQAASDTGSLDSDNITADNTPGFDVICTEAGSLLTLYSDNPAAGTVAGTHSCSAAGTVTLTANTLADGSHTFTYTETDPAGNESLSSPGLAVVIDTTVADPSCATAPSAANDTTDVTTTCGSVESAAVVTIPGMICGTESGGSVTCTGTVGSGGLDGADTTVTVTDTAGNTNTSENSGLVVDNTAPHVPYVHLDLSAGADIPVVTFVSTDNVAIDHYEIDYYPNDGVAGTVPATQTTLTPATSPQTLTLDPDESPHIIVVRAVDTAGNHSESTVHFPTNITFNAPTSISNTPITDSTFTVTSPDGNSLTNILLTSSNGTAPTIVCGGGPAPSYASPVLCTIGEITQTTTLTVTAQETVTASTGQKMHSYVIETGAPVITVTAPTKSANADIIDTTVTITDNYGVDSTDITLTAENSTGTFGVTAVNCRQTHTSQVDCILTLNGEGTGDIRVNALDNAGNAAPATESGYLIDRTAPSTQPGAPDLLASSDTGISDSDNNTSDNTPSFAIVCAENGSIVTLYTDNPAADTAAGTYNCTGSGTVTLTANAVVDGTHSFSYAERDPLGNSSLRSPTLPVGIDTGIPPTLSAPAVAGTPATSGTKCCWSNIRPVNLDGDGVSINTRS